MAYASNLWIFFSIEFELWPRNIYIYIYICIFYDYMNVIIIIISLLTWQNFALQVCNNQSELRTRTNIKFGLSSLTFFRIIYPFEKSQMYEKGLPHQSGVNLIRRVEWKQYYSLSHLRSYEKYASQMMTSEMSKIENFFIDFRRT